MARFSRMARNPDSVFLENNLVNNIIIELKKDNNYILVKKC